MNAMSTLVPFPSAIYLTSLIEEPATPLAAVARFLSLQAGQDRDVRSTVRFRGGGGSASSEWFGYPRSRTTKGEASIWIRRAEAARGTEFGGLETVLYCDKLRLKPVIIAVVNTVQRSIISANNAPMVSREKLLLRVM